jgi:hypothetical protein
MELAVEFSLVLYSYDIFLVSMNTGEINSTSRPALLLFLFIIYCGMNSGTPPLEPCL